MASRAEALAARPGIVRSVVDAGQAFYYNSVRFVAANAIWGTCLVGVLALALLAPVLALLALPLVALPAVGVVRMAALAARHEGVALADGFAAWRELAVPSLMLGVGLLIAVLVAAWDIVVGLASATLAGWAFATAAAWALVFVLAFATSAWPILADPARSAAPVRVRLRLAALLVLAHPWRLAGLAIGLAVFAAVAALAVVVLLTLALAFVALVACHVVLPAADALEARLAARGGA